MCRFRRSAACRLFFFHKKQIGNRQAPYFSLKFSRDITVIPRLFHVRAELCKNLVKLTPTETVIRVFALFRGVSYRQFPLRCRKAGGCPSHRPSIRQCRTRLYHIGIFLVNSVRLFGILHIFIHHRRQNYKLEKDILPSPRKLPPRFNAAALCSLVFGKAQCRAAAPCPRIRRPARNAGWD